MLGVIMLSVVMKSFVMLSVTMLSVDMLSVAMLNVVAPQHLLFNAKHPCVMHRLDFCFDEFQIEFCRFISTLINYLRRADPGKKENSC